MRSLPLPPKIAQHYRLNRWVRSVAHAAAIERRTTPAARRPPPARGVSHYRPLVIQHDDAPPIQPNGEPLKVPVVAGAK